MFGLKKEKDDQLELLVSSENNEDFQDRLFFHDLINQTHGLLLFLDQKEFEKKEIGFDDLNLIKSEIKTLQGLVRDHFKMKHKNLSNTQSYTDINGLKRVIDFLINTYLAHENVKLSFNVLSGLDNEFSISYPYFYRICNNLIKNISEATGKNKDSEIVIFFEVTKLGLFIETQNSLPHLLKNDIPEYLEKVILNEKSMASEGLGIESIDRLTKNCRGTFSFEIENNHWVNKIFLPNDFKIPIKKAA